MLLSSSGGGGGGATVSTNLNRFGGAGGLGQVVIFYSQMLNSSISYTGTGPFTYNGAAQGPVVSFNTGSTGAMTTNYVGTGGTVYNSVTAPTNAGTYYLSNTVAGDANYAGATNSQAFVIGKATATLAVDNSPVSYDGNPHAAEVVVVGNPVPGYVTNVLMGGAASQTALVSGRAWLTISRPGGGCSTWCCSMKASSASPGLASVAFSRSFFDGA